MSAFLYYILIQRRSNFYEKFRGARIWPSHIPLIFGLNITVLKFSYSISQNICSKYPGPHSSPPPPRKKKKKPCALLICYLNIHYLLAFFAGGGGGGAVFEVNGQLPVSVKKNVRFYMQIELRKKFTVLNYGGSCRSFLSACALAVQRAMYTPGFLVNERVNLPVKIIFLQCVKNGVYFYFSQHELRANKPRNLLYWTP